MEILKTTNLTKKYKNHMVVDNLNMHLSAGEIYGFLGQNGAGKTTTLRMIMGLIEPTAGEIELFGRKLAGNRKEILRKIGTIIEFPGFYPNLTAAENLEIHRLLMGIKDKNCIVDSLSTAGLLEAKGRIVKEFSLGMKQRLGIARALLHRPELLVLDEPTNGLDPVGIKEVRQLILDLARKEGISVLVSSHILSEVQQMANKVGIIHEGKLLEEIDLAALQGRTRQYIEIKVSNEKAALSLLRDKMQITDLAVLKPGCILIYERLPEAHMMNRLLVQSDIEVRELKLIRESLEDHFVELTGGATVA